MVFQYGIRVDEGGRGGIVSKISGSTIEGNLADGGELDEIDDGDVWSSLKASSVSFNGDTSAYDVDYTDEYGNTGTVEDRDDGFDIDEAGSGSILGSVKNVSVTGNHDEGLDFDESDAGGFDVSLVNIEGSDNGDEAVKLSEENLGDLVASLRAVTAIENGNDGMELEEEDSGNVDVSFRSSTATDNEGSGIKVVEDGSGDLTMQVMGTTAENNGEDDDSEPGLEVEQGDDGQGYLRVRGSYIDEIDDSGVQLDEK